MAIRWPWQPISVQSVRRSAVLTAQRSYDVPEKVFIERESTGHYEYSFDDARIQGYIENILDGFYSHQNFVELFHCLPEVFAPVHEIASRVSDCNWQLRKIRKGGGENDDQPIYTDSQFNRLFTQPNPLMAMKQFVYQAVVYEILTGKQFFYANIPSTLPNEFNSVINWWNLQAQSVKAEVNENVDPYSATTLSDFIRKYTQPVNGRNRTFTTETVLPICNLSLSKSHDINTARSILRGADKPIRNLIPVYEARGTIYVKRGALGFMVSRKSDDSGLQPLTKLEKERALKDMESTYGLSRGKSPMGITDVPLDFVRTAMSIQELQPFDETLADAVAIYAVLRVPRHLVPSKDTSTYANAASDMKSFYADVIIPWAQRYAEAWTNFFKLEDNRKYIHADFSHVPVLQDNRKEKAEVDKINGTVYLQRFTSGICTLNDWIAATGAQASPLALYNKRIYEMTPEELEQVKAVFNMKSVVPADGEKEKEDSPENEPVTA